MLCGLLLELAVDRIGLSLRRLELCAQCLEFRHQIGVLLLKVRGSFFLLLEDLLLRAQLGGDLLLPFQLLDVLRRVPGRVPSAGLGSGCVQGLLQAVHSTESLDGLLACRPKLFGDGVALGSLLVDLSLHGGDLPRQRLQLLLGCLVVYIDRDPDGSVVCHSLTPLSIVSLSLSLRRCSWWAGPPCCGCAGTIPARTCPDASRA